MPLISLNPLFCLWNCFLLLPWLIGHLASSKKTNGNVREGKDTLHATWPVPVNISLHTQYTFLYSCALNAHTLLHVLKLLFFLSLSAGVWFSAMNLSYFQVTPHYVPWYLSTESLADHWRSVTLWRPFYRSTKIYSPTSVQPLRHHLWRLQPVWDQVLSSQSWGIKQDL